MPRGGSIASAALPGVLLMTEESFEVPYSRREGDVAAERRMATDRLYLLDLIRVLKPHPTGLRRWSVMRAIRKHRDAAGLPILQSMEDAVERVFRNHCA